MLVIWPGIEKRAWHPSAADVLLSAGADHTIRIWNTKAGESMLKLTVHPDTIQSVLELQWVLVCNILQLRVIDPRAGEVLAEGKGHEGNKPCKVIFCRETNLLFSTGFSGMSDRKYAIWDPRDLTKPMVLEDFDPGVEVMFPFWDEGTDIVCIAGKGDTQIKFFEVTPEEAPYVHFLNTYQSTNQQRGVAVMPTRELDHMNYEVMRFYLVNPNGSINPVAMTVPRKSDTFQEDIYPPCPAGKPALTAEEWFGGVDKDPFLLKITETGLEEMHEAECQVYHKTYKELREVYAALKEKFATKLEGK